MGLVPEPVCGPLPDPESTLVLDLQPPELSRVSVVDKLPSPWYFVIAAGRGQDDRMPVCLLFVKTCMLRS